MGTIFNLINENTITYHKFINAFRRGDGEVSVCARVGGLLVFYRCCNKLVA